MKLCCSLPKAQKRQIPTTQCCEFTIAYCEKKKIKSTNGNDVLELTKTTENFIHGGKKGYKNVKPNTFYQHEEEKNSEKLNKGIIQIGVIQLTQHTQTHLCVSQK